MGNKLLGAVGILVMATGVAARPPAATTTRPTGAAATAPTGRPSSYQAWARFDPGAAATYTTSFSMDGGPPFVHTLSCALKRLSAKRADVVMTVVETHNPPEARLQQYAADDPADDPAELNWSATGSEDVVVGGHAYRCVTYAARGKGLLPYNGSDPDAEAKVWVCDDVPGGVVRLRATASDGGSTHPVVSDQMLTGLTGHPAPAGRAVPAAGVAPVTAASMWLPFRPGSRSAYTTTVRTPGVADRTGTITFTLIAVNAAEGAMVNVAASAPGQPAQSVPMAIHAVDPSQPEGTPAGTEDVTVGGHVYHCRVYATGGERGRAKMWASDAVPGGIVKMHAAGPGGATNDMALTSCQAK